MSARETALLRLRAGGSLLPATRATNVITAEQAANPLGQQLKRIIEQNIRPSGPRCLAPSANHAVLP